MNAKVVAAEGGFQRKCTVHSQVASAFLGDCPPNHEITHKDGDYTHNEVTNLEYVTRRENLAAYTTALNYFTESCHKQNLDEVEREDLLKFSPFLRDEKEQAPRSVYNKLENVMTFLKANGIGGLAGKNDWPRYTEEEPEMYEQEELDKLFKALRRRGANLV